MPRGFGGVSKKILQCLVNNGASRVAIVFDRYFTPSIKDYEQSLRDRQGLPHFRSSTNKNSRFYGRLEKYIPSLRKLLSIF